MSLNQQSVNEKDIQLLEQIDDTIEDIQISIQKAISLTHLNAPTEEIFSEIFRLVAYLEELTSQTVNDTARLVAQGKVQIAIHDLESRLSIQLNK